MSSSTRFRVHPIPADHLQEVRRSDRDASGSRPVRVDAEGEEPLRCCLRYAHPGEDLILFGYEPPIPPGPYREVGPVFAHAEPCAGRDDTGRDDVDYPADWRGKPQAVRAYDSRGWIRDATVHDGEQPEKVVASLLADPAVTQVHSRNVAHGCYMFRVTRAD